MSTRWYELIIALGSMLSLQSLHVLGTGLGRILCVFLAVRRQEAQLRMVQTLGFSQKEAVLCTRKSFEHSGRAFLEIFHTRSVSPRFLKIFLEIDRPDLVQRLQNTDRPVLAITGHFGSWELLGGLLAMCPNIPACGVVVRLPRNTALSSAMMHMRSGPHVEVIPHRHAASRALNVLRQKGLAAFLVDHNCRTAEAEFLPFLGEQAAVNKGPALLALRARAEVWPVFLVRLPEGRLRLLVHDPLDTRSLQGTRQEKVRQICEFYTQAVEHVVRTYPEQWFWMHRRWKNQPVEDM